MITATETVTTRDQARTLRVLADRLDHLAAMPALAIYVFADNGIQISVPVAAGKVGARMGMVDRLADALDEGDTYQDNLHYGTRSLRVSTPTASCPCDYGQVTA